MPTPDVSPLDGGQGRPPPLEYSKPPLEYSKPPLEYGNYQLHPQDRFTFEHTPLPGQFFILC